MKINLRQSLYFIVLLSIVVYADFVDFIPTSIWKYFFGTWAVLSFFMAVDVKNAKLTFTPWKLRIWAEWIVMLVLYVVGNAFLKYGYVAGFLRGLSLMLFCMVLPMAPPRYLYPATHMLAGFGAVHAIATFFFFLFPQAYSMMIRYYGKAPVGTANGLNGYHAGITSHYSSNGAMLVIFVFAVTAFLIADILYQKHLNRRILMWALAVAAMLALLMTTKRAHFLFGVLSIIFVYYLIRPNKIFSTSVKLLAVGALIAVFLVILVPNVPILNDMYIRFTRVGADNQSHARLTLANLAIRLFKEHPILGIGWSGYIYAFNSMLYNGNGPETMNAHNVYLQLLCERGVVGLAVYVFIILKNIVSAAVTFVQREQRKIPYEGMVMLLFSLMFQFFFIVHAVTENPLYDTLFFYYPISLGMAYSVFGAFAKSDRRLQNA